MSDPKTESYVVNISENERLDILLVFNGTSWYFLREFYQKLIAV